MSPTQGDSWTVLELLRWTTGHFEKLGIESARLDAECLLAHALAVDRLGLYVDFEKPVSKTDRAAFRELVQRRGGDRVPVAQLVGVKEFWSLSLAVTSEVLVPRPDTETLVMAALERMPDADGEIRVLDVGTGSGAIALAIAQERPKARLVATDVSAAALAVARENAGKLGLEERIVFLEGTIFEPVAGQLFDLVVSNPPYLAESAAGELPPELAHEPRAALFGGPDGLAVLRELVAGVQRVLVPGGSLVLETAPDQAEKVAAWCREAGFETVACHRDLGNRLRAVSASRPADNDVQVGGGS